MKTKTSEKTVFQDVKSGRFQECRALSWRLDATMKTWLRCKNEPRNVKIRSEKIKASVYDLEWTQVGGHCLPRKANPHEGAWIFSGSLIFPRAHFHPRKNHGDFTRPYFILLYFLLFFRPGEADVCFEILTQSSTLASTCYILNILSD